MTGPDAADLRVVAVRDDGALLVASGPAAVIVGKDGGQWVTGRDAALSRGEWAPSEVPVPDLDADTLAALKAYRAELGDGPEQAMARLSMDYPVDVEFPDQGEEDGNG